MPDSPSKSPRISVRYAKPAEMDAVWDLDRHNLAENWNFSPLSSQPLSRADLIRRHHAIITRWYDPTRHKIIVAARGEELLGLAWYSVEPDPLFDVKIGFLFSIVVHPKQRGNGVARKLMKAFMARVKRDGAKFARLAVLHQNWPALNLYREAGFVDETHYMIARLEPTKPEKAKQQAAARKATQKR